MDGENRYAKTLPLFNNVFCNARYDEPCCNVEGAPNGVRFESSNHTWTTAGTPVKVWVGYNV